MQNQGKLAPKIANFFNKLAECVFTSVENFTVDEWLNFMIPRLFTTLH